MRKETALKRIKARVEQALPKEPQAVKDYISDLILTGWEASRGIGEEGFRTDTETLETELEINLIFEIESVLTEARKEALKK